MSPKLNKWAFWSKASKAWFEPNSMGVDLGCFQLFLTDLNQAKQGLEAKWQLTNSWHWRSTRAKSQAKRRTVFVVDFKLPVYPFCDSIWRRIWDQAKSEFLGLILSCISICFILYPRLHTRYEQYNSFPSSAPTPGQCWANFSYLIFFIPFMCLDNF